MTVFSMPNYRNSSYSLILVALDLIAYFASLVLAYATRVALEGLPSIVQLQFSFWHFIFQLWWIILMFVVIIASFGLYSRRIPFWKEARDLMKASTTTFILAFAVISIGKMSEDISRLVLLLIWFYSSVFLMLFRYALKSKLYNYKFFTENAIVIGSPKEAATAANFFRKEHMLGYNIIGIVTVDKDDDYIKSDYKILGNISRISNIISQNNVSVGIFLPGAVAFGGVSPVIGRVQLMLTKIIIIPDMVSIAFSNAETHQTLMTQLSYFQINNNLKSFVNRSTKRTIDILLCTLSLPILLFLTFIIAVIIKVGSKGPIFYAHQRVGRNGRRIWILKFRSMYIDAADRLEEILKNDKEAKAEWEASFKLKDDPRVTSVGRFLRKTSLDELPQVFNVIIGDMSLIGPRPVISQELDKYYKDFASYYLMVRPGLTGLWQVSGRSNTGYDFRVERDTWYVLNWSIWLDLIILLKTPAVVFKKEGAY